MGCVAYIGEMGDVADVLGEVVCVADIGEMGRETRMVLYIGCVAHIGEVINVYATQIGKPQGKKLLRRTQFEW
jgi:hypothetical protein